MPFWHLSFYLHCFLYPCLLIIYRKFRFLPFPFRRKVTIFLCYQTESIPDVRNCFPLLFPPTFLPQDKSTILCCSTHFTEFVFFCYYFDSFIISNKGFNYPSLKPIKLPTQSISYNPSCQLQGAGQLPPLFKATTFPPLYFIVPRV